MPPPPSPAPAFPLHLPRCSRIGKYHTAPALPMSSHSGTRPLHVFILCVHPHSASLPHPCRSKVNNSDNLFTTKTEDTLSSLSCSLEMHLSAISKEVSKKQSHLQRAQPQVDFGYGKHQVRHGELKRAVKSRAETGNSHISEEISSLATSYMK